MATSVLLLDHSNYPGEDVKAAVDSLSAGLYIDAPVSIRIHSTGLLSLLLGGSGPVV